MGNVLLFYVSTKKLAFCIITVPFTENRMKPGYHYYGITTAKGLKFRDTAGSLHSPSLELCFQLDLKCELTTAAKFSKMQGNNHICPSVLQIL